MLLRQRRSSVTNRVTLVELFISLSISLFPVLRQSLNEPSLVYRVDKIDEYKSAPACIIRFYTASRTSARAAR